ncbi:ATP-binding protein [Ruminococcaceae bacterium OttesenSCG-928-A16]|nr:ATP-binding protein [Ruminococcaceae bacterium OttesenSCG-928-A16]
MFHVGQQRYSKTWSFSDINYSVSSEEDRLSMFMGHCTSLNSFQPGTSYKLSIVNRNINKRDFEQNMLIPLQGDALDGLRREKNAMIAEAVSLSNNIIQEKYITASVEKKNPQDARSHLSRVGNDLAANFGKLNSKVSGLDIGERLRLFHDFFRSGQESDYSLDIRQSMRLGSDFRDYICPDGLQFKKDHFTVGKRVGRVLFLKDLPSFLSDAMVADLTDFPHSLILSIDILPIPTDEAVKVLQNKVLGIETDITRWQQKQNQNNNWASEPPYELSHIRDEMKEFLDDLTKRDQRMMYGYVTLVHLADTKEQLDEDTETLLSIGSKYMCQFAPLHYQQEDGLNTVLPYGLRLIDNVRTLTTESLAVLMPFSTQDVMHKGGVYVGTNVISKNPIFVDRAQLLNPHGFILGVSGSGKSVTMKDMMILMALLYGRDEVFIFDVEREYAAPVTAIGGSVIRFSPNSPHRVNIMELDRHYAGDDNPILIKSELLMSVVEQQMGAGNLGAKQKSIIDRCVAAVYREYLKDFRGKPPEMLDVYKALLAQPEPEAKDIALVLELLTTGSLNIFSGQTNVDISSRVTCFDLHELGKTLEPVGHAVMLDFLGNKVAQNFEKGIRTHIFIDEVHMYFANQYSALFLSRAWKRYRKKGAYLLAATQNITECLASETARLMLSNSEYMVLLNQAASDRAELAKLLNISDTQMSFITNSEAGSGLVKVQGALVPFANKIPKNTDYYRLISTKPGEE